MRHHEEMTMRLRTLICCVILLVTGLFANAQYKAPLREGVRLELTKPTQEGALVHWKITNTLDTAVYVYDFYLWGPAYHIERADSRLIINTTPVAEQASCPPNRFPPVLLLVVGAHRTIEGDFMDTAIKDAGGKLVSMRIAVGSDPYSVVEEAKQFMSSKCKHSPYDAIVRWGTILESNAIRTEPTLANGTMPTQ
jgi:hypothetical protein